MIRCLILIMLLFLGSVANADEQPPSIGNFALRGSQQPGQLIGFGGNIIDQNEIQIFLFADDFIGVNEHSIDLAPIFIYGISDSFSITMVTPYAVSYKSGQQTSNGFEDIYTQLEYAFYQSSTSRFTEQATLLVNLSIPTGSIQKNPSTGIGSVSFFPGFTYNRTYVDWFFFGATGAQLTTEKNGTRYGNSYLYQFGFGKNITNINGWILAWITEIDGVYSQHNRISGATDPNSGGNVIYVTPSFWASTKQFIFQLGVGVAATQHWNGKQTRNKYLLAGDIGWSF